VKCFGASLVVGTISALKPLTVLGDCKAQELHGTIKLEILFFLLVMGEFSPA